MKFSRAFLPAMLLLLLWSCGGSKTQQEDTALAAPKSAARSDDELDKFASELAARARADEPATTALIRKVAADTGHSLIGLDHRLKSIKSIRRKLRLRAGELGSPRDVELNDTLRYTFLIDDDPLGSHTKAVATILKAFEKNGHKVSRVKNYWPKGDNYSGINTVLESESGLLWELQFHTQGSLRVKTETRALYEEFRAEQTPILRKQELFDQISVQWETVPIPQAVLVPHSLHASEEIIDRPRPE